MGFLNRVKKWVVKNVFGYDAEKQEKRIKALQKRVGQLEQENARLKGTIKAQKILLDDCNENLQRIFKMSNKHIQCHIYFGVQGYKRKTIRNFEFIISGVCNPLVSEDEIDRYFVTDQYIRYLLSLFKIDWLDANIIVGKGISGYNESLTEHEPTPYLDVALIIEDGGINGEDVKRVINRWD